MMTVEECNAQKKKMEASGWVCDRDEDDIIGFSKYEDEKHEWIRDYNKKTRSFVQFNGRQMINLVQKTPE